MLHRCLPYADLLPPQAAPWVLAAPLWVQALHAQVARGAGLRRLPRLVWLSHAGGRGGYTDGDMVALGAEDTAHVAQRIAAGGAHGGEVYCAVVRVILAHEIGHVLQAEHGMMVPCQLAERAADNFAGQVAETHGWPAWLDAMVMSAGGSPTAGREHAGAAQRVADYHEGRARIRRRARRAA